MAKCPRLMFLSFNLPPGSSATSEQYEVFGVACFSWRLTRPNSTIDRNIGYVEYSTRAFQKFVRPVPVPSAAQPRDHRCWHHICDKCLSQAMSPLAGKMARSANIVFCCTSGEASRFRDGVLGLCSIPAQQK